MHEVDPVTEPVDTSFVPQLDARQRAMLAEMGVRVWAPRAVPVATVAPMSLQPGLQARLNFLHPWR